MPKIKTKEDARLRRKMRLRRKISGNPDMPRLCVYRSLNHIYVQAIDDRSGKTLLSASSLEIKGKAGKTGNKEAAKLVGELMAEKCKQKGIDAVTFDRSGYLYHGRVKALAEAARAAGLKF
ncbi:50S ribosomal protein L18 [bacterium]|nr:50S ribosomal protein L18 [bacterium]MCI0606047.1 50S ribosomal protein L18 [bacterium]